jgi:hypothetical protein
LATKALREIKALPAIRVLRATKALPGTRGSLEIKVL